MKESFPERAAIDEQTLTRLCAEKERTGLGPNKILRYMRSRGLLPEGSKLKLAQMESWITGLAKSAPKADVDAIFEAYAGIVPLSKLDSLSDDNQLIVICDALAQELSSVLQKRHNSCRRIILKGPMTPKGLTEHRLGRLATGEDKTILAAHLKHIRHVTREFSKTR